MSPFLRRQNQLSIFYLTYQKAETFEEGKRFKPWLYAIATNQAIDASRKRKRRQTISLENEWDSGESSAKAGSLRDVLESNNEKPDSSAMMDEKKVKDTYKWGKNLLGLEQDEA